MYVLIDNYDSFTYILHDYILRTGKECLVFRNDEITIPQLAELNPERLIISPGPETPERAGITMEVIAQFHATIPILGVCLGHQAIGQYFGGQVSRLPYPMHGKTSICRHNGHWLFKDVPESFEVMRYHSLAVERIDDTRLQVLASAGDGCVMAIAHPLHPCIGLQFHPESVGTTYGSRILSNWVEARYL